MFDPDPYNALDWLPFIVAVVALIFAFYCFHRADEQKRQRYVRDRDEWTRQTQAELAMGDLLDSVDWPGWPDPRVSTEGDRGEPERLQVA